MEKASFTDTFSKSHISVKHVWQTLLHCDSRVFANWKCQCITGCLKKCYDHPVYGTGIWTHNLLHKSPPITTRPVLPPIIQIITYTLLWKLKISKISYKKISNLYYSNHQNCQHEWCDQAIKCIELILNSKIHRNWHIRLLHLLHIVGTGASGSTFHQIGGIRLEHLGIGVLEVFIESCTILNQI